MQTPKGRSSSVEVPQKTSPVTPRAARRLKTQGLDSPATPNSAGRVIKERSPKITERRSPQSPLTEKKRPTRVSELESLVTQLQEDLKKANDQLSSSESWKRRAQQEAEEAKKQVFSMQAKLEELQQQLLELSASEDARVHELGKISQDRDRAWQSELEAVQKQHFMDSASLASAVNEIQKLRKQLGFVSESEASYTKHAESAHSEIQSLRLELAETLSLVEKLKTELNKSRKSEAQYMEVLKRTQSQLETAKETAEALRLDGHSAVRETETLTMELEQSKAQVNLLEELVSNLRKDLDNTNGATNASVNPLADHNKLVQENNDITHLKEELDFMKCEAEQLKVALDAAEMKYQQECIQSILQNRGAHEQLEKMQLESCAREADLNAYLRDAKANIEELKAELVDKETKLLNISAENEKSSKKVENSQSVETELRESVSDLKANLLDKETELQSIVEENEGLRSEIQKQELEKKKEDTKEREALSYLREEVDKSSRRAEQMTEQLDSAQAANSELESELRRLKIQSDQWRKAAELATSMLSTGKNGNFVERTGSLDSCNTIGGKMGSPFLDDLDDDVLKRKNGNMLKKIGDLWKKVPK